MSRRRSGCARPRRPLGERLESRNLLAGLVQVEFIDGSLFVSGDEAANEFRIEQTIGNGTTKEGLRVVPDATTSLNGLPPGVPLELGPRTLASLQIETGHGDDQVVLNGISTSEKLVFRNPGGLDALHIVDVDLDGALDAASAAPLQLKIEGSSFAVDAFIKLVSSGGGSAVRSSLSLDGTHIKGDMFVESTSPLDITGKTSSTRAAYIKFDGVDGESFSSSSPPSSLDVQSFSWGASLRVDSSVPSSISLKDSDCDDARFSFGAMQTGGLSGGGAGGGAGRSSLSLHGTHIKGEMLVESTSPLDIKGESSSTRAAYIKFDGIKGDVVSSSSSSSSSSLDVQSFSWGASLRVVSSVSSSISLKDSDCDDARFSFGATQTGGFSGGGGAGGGAGRSSLSLHGTHIKGDMLVESTSPLDIKGESSSTRAAFIKFDGIKGDAVSSSSSSSSLDVESFSFGSSLSVVSRVSSSISLKDSDCDDARFSFGAAQTGASSGGGGGAGRSSLSLDGTHIKGEMLVESTSPLDIKGESSSTRAAFIKFDGIKGEARSSSLDVESFSFGSSLSVVSSVSASITLHDSDCDDASFSWGASQSGRRSSSSSNARSSLTVDALTVTGSMFVSSDSPLSTSVVDSSLAEDFHIKLSSLSGETRRSSVSIEGTTIDEGLRVESSAPTDLSLSSSRVHGDTYLKYELKDVFISSFQIDDSELGDLSVEGSAIVSGRIMDSSIDGNARLNFSKIRFDRSSSSSSSSASSLELQGLTIVGSTELYSSQPLSIALEACSTGETSLHFDGVKGESRLSSVSVLDCDIDGDLRIESSSAIHIKSESTWAESTFIKLDGVAGESASSRKRSSVDLEDLQLAGSLRIESTTPADLTLENSRVQDETYLKYQLKEVFISSFSLSGNDLGPLLVDAVAAVDGSIVDTSIDGDARFNYAKIRTERLSSSSSSSLEVEGLTVVGTTELLSSQPLSFSASSCDLADIYLKFEGTRGEQRSTETSFDDCVVDGQLSIVSSSPLRFDMTESSVYDRLSLSLSSSSSSSSSLSIDGSEFGGLRIESSAPVRGQLRDSFVEGDLDVALQKIRERPRSTERSTLSFDGLFVAGETDVQSSQPVSLEVSACAFDDDFYLKLSGMRGELRGASVEFFDSQVAGALHVESSMSLEFSGDSSTARSSFLKLDGVLGESTFGGRTGVVQLEQFVTQSSLVIESGVPVEISAVSSRVGGDFYLKLDDISSTSSSRRGRFSARDFVVSGGLTVVGSDGDDSLRFEKLQVGGAADIRLGDGADRCMLVDSIFASSASLDGGAGTDLLGLPNTTFKRERVLRNWESTVNRDDGK